MSKKSQFCPHIYADWAELFKGLTDQQKADVLMGITLYPDYTPENNPVWGFIKLQIDKEYQAYNERCEKNQEVAKARWEMRTDAKKCDGIRTSTKKYQKMPITEYKQELEYKQEQNSKYGELGYVRLTAEQYNTLKTKHQNIDEAIEVLDTWLGTSGSKNRNKNHYAYFKENSWVWERLEEQHKQPDKNKQTESIDDIIQRMKLEEQHERAI